MINLGAEVTEFFKLVSSFTSMVIDKRTSSEMEPKDWLVDEVRNISLVEAYEAG